MEKLFLFKNISKLFRVLEICFAIVFLPWLCSQLPFVANIVNTFVTKMIAVTKSPIFIFTLFNSILAAIYIKSGQLSENQNMGKDLETDLFDGLAASDDSYFPSLTETEEVVYQDKEMIDEAIVELEEEAVKESAVVKEEECCMKIVCQPKEEKCNEVAVIEEEEENEELSSEEFKRTIEDFIAKQTRFHFEEKMAIVAC